MTRCLLLVASAAALATPAPAAAALTLADVADAQRAAVATFPTVATTCPAGVAVTVGPLATATAYAMATRPCDVRLRISWAAVEWPVLCRVMAHEYGHLAGHDHSLDPANLMHAQPTADPPACAARTRLRDRRADIAFLRQDLRWARLNGWHDLVRARKAALRRAKARARQAKAEIIRLDSHHTGQ